MGYEEPLISGSVRSLLFQKVTDAFIRMYRLPGSAATYAILIRNLRVDARMAKLADAADLKSAGRKRLWGFKSPSGHHISTLVPMTRFFGGTQGFPHAVAPWHCTYH